MIEFIDKNGKSNVLAESMQFPYKTFLSRCFNFLQMVKDGNVFSGQCRKMGFTLLCILTCLSGTYAQKAVTGMVTDNKGESLPGVSVLVKGTKTGTSTDINGEYNLNVSSQDILVYSYLGFQSQEIPVNDQTTINVTLEEDVKGLNEVVVTALGIKREKKALGYAMQEVNTDGFLETKTESVSNMLQGKVAGVQISQSATGVGGSTRIIMRGMNSLSGNNQPLWVVDGVPIRDDASGASASEWSGSDAAGAASEINPDDIATISVLKGPNAAALYGSRAQNGVIIVTTKGASQDQPINITYNGNYSWSQMFGGYDFQWDYGQGNQGIFNISSKDNWGPKMTGQMIENWRKYFYDKDVPDYAMAAQKDRINDFFRTGFNSSNSVSIAGGGKYLASRFSFTDSRNQGITPGNSLNRQYFDLSSNFKYDNFTADAKVTYSRQTMENPVSLGEYGMMQMFTTMPSNIRLSDLQDNMTIDNIPMNWSGPSNEYVNPYTYISSMRDDNQKRERLIGMISLNYKFTNWLGITGRTGLDRIQNDNYSYGLRGTNGTNPTYYRSFANLSETNSDLMLNFNKTFDRFAILANAGGSIMDSRSDALSANSGPLVLYGFNRLSNGSKIDASDYTSEKQIHSALGNAQFAYNNYLYLDVTARNDWSSALPSNNRSYFYPSASLSAILSDMLSLPKTITFLKVRGSWAQVGNDTDPYRLSPSYGFNTTNPSVTWADIGTWKTFDDLKPEKTTSVEFGLDLRLFSNRIGLDATYYNSNTVNQIIPLNIPQSSGYTNKFINAGQINSRGFEVSLNTTPVQSRSWRWDLNLNWGTNTSKCVKLYDGITTYTLGSMRIGEIDVIEGKKYGEIRSKAFVRDDKGRIVVDDNGLPIATDEYQTIGNISPDWTGSITNRLQYKNFVLSALIDIRYGGNILSVTDALATAAGTSQRTLAGRDGMVVNGVTQDGQVNTKSVSAEQYWQSVGGAYGIGEAFLYSGTYAKLREVSFGYNLPKSLLQKKYFVKGAKISLVGRDLFYLKKNTPGTDPEGASIRDDWAQGFELNALPSTRTFGFNLSLTF